MLIQLCVRDMLRLGVFPLASPLPSTTSLASGSASFGGFVGTMGLSDFPCPCIIGVRPWTFRCGLGFTLSQTDTGSPGFRSRCLRACAGSQTAPGPKASRDTDASSLAFRLVQERRHLGVAIACAMVVQFRGSIPRLHVLLSTLHPYPCGRRYMTRRQCGSLLLHCMKLSFTTPCRLLPAHLNFEPGNPTIYFPSRPFMTSLIRLNIGVMSAYLGSETSKYFFPETIRLN